MIKGGIFTAEGKKMEVRRFSLRRIILVVNFCITHYSISVKNDTVSLVKRGENGTRTENRTG